MIIDIQATTKDAMHLIHEGNLALADLEETGIKVDVAYCRKQYQHLSRRIKWNQKKLMESKEVKLWRRTFGGNFNLNSDHQLAHILFEVLKYEPEILTDNGNPSVSEEALSLLKVPFMQYYVGMKRMSKMQSTYIGKFLKEQVNGYMHPFFNLLLITGRSSSSNPNFQNNPKRDKNLLQIVRRAIIPELAAMLGGLDFSGIEVHGATWYHHDPTMIEYLTNPASDMHLDMSMECFLLDHDQVSKPIRTTTKNGFVFPQFYGDWYKANALSMWRAIDRYDLRTSDGTPLKEHLKKEGIKSLKAFEELIREVENHFWNERFPVYSEWKEEWWNAYLANGYFHSLTGFKFSGLMDQKNVINYPVQCVAFHCLLWSLIKLNDLMKKEKLRSKIIGQIHDEIVPVVYPEEMNFVLQNARQIMTKDIRDHWGWINTPIEIEAEMGPINGAWDTTEEIHNTKCTSCYSEWVVHKKLDDGRTQAVCRICGDQDVPY